MAGQTGRYGFGIGMGCGLIGLSLRAGPRMDLSRTLKVMEMIGQLVEIHLLNGKRFFGKVHKKDSEGVTLYGVPVKALESITPGMGALDQLREMLHTVFFAWQQVEYIDIGGEPIGFETLYSSWFKEQTLDEFFKKPYSVDREKKEEE